MCKRQQGAKRPLNSSLWCLVHSPWGHSLWALGVSNFCPSGSGPESDHTVAFGNCTLGPVNIYDCTTYAPERDGGSYSIEAGFDPARQKEMTGVVEPHSGIRTDCEMDFRCIRHKAHRANALKLFLRFAPILALTSLTPSFPCSCFLVLLRKI